MTAGIRTRRPPAALMRFLVNPVTRLVARTPWARRPGSLAVLTFTTRRTGRRRRIPVLVHRVGADTLVFTDATWAANFAGGRPLLLTRQGRTVPAIARLITNPAETAAGLRGALLEQGSPRRLGLVLDDGYRPSDAELAALRRMIRIETSPA